MGLPKIKLTGTQLKAYSQLVSYLVIEFHIKHDKRPSIKLIYIFRISDL